MTQRSKAAVSRSRRGFLKTLGFAGAAAALPVVLPGAADAAAEGRELATLLDLEKCVACGACVEACREENAARYPEPRKPFPEMLPKRVKVEDWSEKRDVDDRLTPYNWLYIQTVNGEWNGRPFEVNAPRRCMHCQNPPCANLCPFGAAAKHGNGAVTINPDVCLGGAKCRSVCPWDIPQRQTGVGLYLRMLPKLAGNGVMFKCRRCLERVASGSAPACVEACPEGVQTIGPREEIVARAEAMAAERGGYLYGLTENGGTNTIYYSPVPFEVLNAAAGKGPGRPHLGPAKDVMSDETTMAAALAVAPVAGLAAGLIKAGRAAARMLKETDNG